MSHSSVLHVAALPFPSYQGTQAAIRAMLEASTRAGGRAELFTYADEGYPLVSEFARHRTGRTPRLRSLRSGPSLRKLALDARMLFELQRLVRRLRPRAIVAHHVEAAALSLGVRATPTLFFAHTDLGAELPSFAHARHRAWLTWAGATLDHALLTRADAVATISPALASRFARNDHHAPEYVPTPWPVPEPIRDDERKHARRRLGLAADSCVALYAGNLDAYQDPFSVLDALAGSRAPAITLLIATDSDERAFLQRAARLAVPCRATALGDEAVRRCIHAAADFAIIPRAVPGGLPIKLLDALARGTPCALSPHAAAGLPLRECVVQAREPTGGALAVAVARLAADRALQRTLAERGRAYIAREHSNARFLAALDSVLAQATSAAQRRRSVPPSAAASALHPEP